MKPVCSLMGWWNVIRLSVQLLLVCMRSVFLKSTSSQQIDATCLHVLCGPLPAGHSQCALVMSPSSPTLTLMLYETLFFHCSSYYCYEYKKNTNKLFLIRFSEYMETWLKYLLGRMANDSETNKLLVHLYYFSKYSSNHNTWQILSF